MPAKFRDALAHYEDALIVVPDGQCLEVYPLEEWQRIESKMREQAVFNPDVREVSRLYVSRAKDVTLDAAGRMLLPPDVREQAGLSKEVTLVGGGLTRFEVWDRTRFEEYERTRAERLPSLFDRLSGMGV